MRVLCPRSVAAGTAVVSVLGHKWSQLKGRDTCGWLHRTRTPAMHCGAHDPGRVPGRSLSVQVEALAQADARVQGGAGSLSPAGPPSSCARRRSVRRAVHGCSGPSVTGRMPANSRIASHSVIEEFWRTRALPPICMLWCLAAVQSAARLNECSVRGVSWPIQTANDVGLMSLIDQSRRMWPPQDSPAA